LSASQLINEIKSGKIHPVYILHGEEPYYIDMVADYIEANLLDDMSKAFNQIIAYGKEIDAKAIVDEAKQYPMMSERRLIIVKEAQELKTLPDLADYIAKPVPHTVLVLCHKHKKLDKRTTFGKSADKLPGTFESKPLYDNQLPGWIGEYAKSIGLKLDVKLAHTLADYLGNDLHKISNELDKLLLNIGQLTPVTSEDIQDQIGISKEFNVFEYQNAIGIRDKTKIFHITNYFIENPKNAPIQVVVSNLYSYFTKLMIAIQHGSQNDQDLARLLGLGNAYFIKDYRSAARNFSLEGVKSILVYLSEIDLKSKGVMNRDASDEGLYRDLNHFILTR
jgi:DNA polymerase III subunit delta